MFYVMFYNKNLDRYSIYTVARRKRLAWAWNFNVICHVHTIAVSDFLVALLIFMHASTKT